jgi:hypothetical protein
MQTVNSVFKGMNKAVISLKNLHNERLHLVNISWYIFGVTECLNEYEKSRTCQTGEGQAKGPQSFVCKPKRKRSLGKSA